MKTRANEIAESNSENKTQLYLDFARELAKKAQEFTCEETPFLQRMSAKEVISYFRKCESADCEYAAYAAAHAAEIWMDKVMSYEQ